MIARLQLRNTPLGGLVDETRAKRIGARSEFNRERIRSRHWELLRQWADKTGLIFDPLNLAGTPDQYAILWFHQERSTAPQGASLRSILDTHGHSGSMDRRARAAMEGASIRATFTVAMPSKRTHSSITEQSPV